MRDEAFRQEEFFDPRDLVQVRYEMLRRHQDRRRRGDGGGSTAFGVSRQAYYVTEAAFEEKGIAGLLPRRRGPRRAHKCTDEILDFAEQWRADLSRGEGRQRSCPETLWSFDSSTVDCTCAEPEEKKTTMTHLAR